MRTLLRHAPTGQYFQSLGNWTTTPQNAHDFRFIARALRFVSKTGFADMELILSLEQPGGSHESIFEAVTSQLRETRKASQGNDLGRGQRTQFSRSGADERWLFQIE